MIIIAPSYQRAKTVNTHNLLPEVRYAVHEFEYADYVEHEHDCIELPDSTRGNIPNVRNWLIDKYGDDDLIFVDDDIDAFTFWDNCEQKHLSGDDLIEHIELMLIIAKDMGACLFGVNPAIDKGSYREYTPFSTTSYISCSFHGMINMKNLPYRYDPSLPLKEDYDFTIQVCNGERKALRFNRYGMKKKDHGNIGGCADYRTLEIEKEQFDLLQRKWGSQIVKKDKASKGYDLNPIIKIPIGGV